MLIIRGKVDILLYEKRTFVRRLEDEAEVLYQKIRSSIDVKRPQLNQIESELLNP